MRCWARHQRKLDDEELDSGDDSDRHDRAGLQDDEEAEEEQQRTINVMQVDMSRVPVPKPCDGEVCCSLIALQQHFYSISHILQTYTMHFPKFLEAEPETYEPENWVAPKTEHHAVPAGPGFNPLAVSNSTLRWRHSHIKSNALESNSRVIRWSDGSLTLQLASDPTHQYKVGTNLLTNPQLNPSKPTPASVINPKIKSLEYKPASESHCYLTVPYATHDICRTALHITAELNIIPTFEQDDDALTRLQESMAAANAKNNKVNPDGTVTILDVTEDPELAKKKAEVAEREKVRAQRRRQLQEERERDRANRVLSKSGLRTGGGGGGGGLTIGGLEDDDGMASSRPKTKKPKRASNRRGDIYSSDEDDDRGGRYNGKQDEYEQDDFLVGSDEELEYRDDDENDVMDEVDAEGEDDDEVPAAPAATSAPSRERERKASPKRASPEEEEDEAAAAGGGGVRSKRRRVIDDEDEEDE